jgi:nucleotide-binding universal stress UspA family protein
MFKNVLIPISSDGIAKSEINKLLKVIGGDVHQFTLAFVSDPYSPYVYAEYGDVLAISDADHKRACESFAKKLFAKAGPKLGGIAYQTCHIYNPSVADGIVDAAKKSKADLIAMASHKRTGLVGIFFGSDTHRVILSTKLPVLVV